MVENEAIMEQLARFIVETESDQIPQEAFEVAKRCFIDCVGVALAGAKQPESVIISDAIRDMGGSPQAGVIAGNFKTSVPLAALANGIMAHALDYDDISTKFLAHPSVNLVPCILALAESKHIPGKEALTAYVIGYEIGANLGDIMGMAFFGRGWHATSVLGVIGAAAAAARILKLDVPKTRTALGAAASMAGGLKLNFGTMTKPLHVGCAAHNGILAAILAAGGFTANDNVFTGTDGFCQVYSGVACDFGRIERNLGKTWYIANPGIQFKPYPCCGGASGCVDAIMELKKRHLDIQPENVDAIECRLSPIMVKGGAFIHSPRTGQEARFSAEYDMTAAVVDGEVTLKQYTDEKVKSPLAQELMKKVSIVHPPDIGIGMDQPQEVMVKLKGGKQYSCRVERYKGTIGNPLSKEEFRDKFTDCASVALSPGAVEETLSLLWRMEELEDTARLMELITFCR